MSPRRISVLLGKELVRGPRNFVFIMALVVPVAMTLILALLFGTVFSGKARLGIVDSGNSELVQLANARASLVVKTYATEADLREAVTIGAVDLGVALPEQFDRRIHNARSTELIAYTWGESTLQNRVIVATALGTMIRDIAGQDLPVDLKTVFLGNEDVLSWEERLLPFIVLYAIVLGGTMVPATSLVQEKQKRTLSALTITPASLGDVLMAKALLGIFLSIFMGVLTLILNRAFGSQPALLVFVLTLGAIFSAALGVLLGSFIKDINTLFTVIKAGGLLLFGPALVYLFPAIPEWVGRIFPTYYLINPVVEITQHGATLQDIWLDLVILALLTVALLVAITAVVRRAARYEGTLNLA